MDVAQIFFGLMELRAFSGSKGPSITRHCSIVPVRELALKLVLPEATNKGREEGRSLLVGLAVSHLAAGRTLALPPPPPSLGDSFILVFQR